MKRNQINTIEGFDNSNPEEGMKLKILLPFRVFLDLSGVKSIVVDTMVGNVGLLPNRLDMVTSVVPGIFNYRTSDDVDCYLALDEGILVKEGRNVFVSVRNAIGGTDLSQLHQLVEKEFLQLDEQEKSFRSTLLRLESGFIQHFRKIQNK